MRFDRFKLFTALVFCGIWSDIVFANLDKAPSAFAAGDSLAVFCDFKDARYEIVYDRTNEKATVRSTIVFDTTDMGKPLFDLIANPIKVTVDGHEVGAEEVKLPDNSSTMRVVNKVLDAGQHTLEVFHELSSGVRFSEGVNSAFLVGDLADRDLAEKYLPTNLEYDSFAMEYSVKFIGISNQQEIFTNGQVTQHRDHYTIQFPAHYNVSAPYFHTAPKGYFEVVYDHLTSIDGRTIPIVVYSKYSRLLEPFAKKTKTIVAELEADYGAFPHNSITIYATPGGGGMEYAGATITSDYALAHELTHSYFARGVMPANGNAGWIDEAIASWRDDGYQRNSSMYAVTTMAAHSQYRRHTDYRAYSDGSMFMSHLDYLFRDLGGLKKFLKNWVGDKKFQPLFTEDFIADLEDFYGVSVQSKFDRHIYGRGSKASKSSTEKSSHKRSPMHMELTPELLEQLL